MDRATAELFLASLFVESTSERQEALRNAAKGTRNWEGLAESLSAHGVLRLFLRNLEQAGIELPPALAPQFEARGGEQRTEEQRTRLGLQRFLAAAGREGIELTLVGASALSFELYPEGERRLGCLEFFVAPEHFERALRAAEQAGLLPGKDALPAWWYRRTGLPLTLEPVAALLRPVRLRSVLHHPSLLLTTREPELLARRKRTQHEGHTVFVLDPLDALLELALALATRAGDQLFSGRRHVLAAATRSDHAIRLDLLLDLRTVIEKHHGALAVNDLHLRAREWSAEPALRAALECLQMGLGFLPGAREWARRVLQGLATAPSTVLAGHTPPVFRPDPIERLPQWLRPSATYLERKNALPMGAAPARLQRARAGHLWELACVGLVAAVGFPLALAGRELGRKARAATWAKAQTPARLSDVNDAWRTAASRAEQQKPLAPRTISLPTKEESVARYPDRYAG